MLLDKIQDRATIKRKLAQFHLQSRQIYTTRRKLFLKISSNFQMSAIIRQWNRAVKWNRGS